jgi:TRAP-type uncharacterized transport system substrate-binding protein
VEDQNSIATPAILVTTDKIDQALLKSFMNYFNNHIQEFKQTSANMSNLEDSHFISNFVVPMHEALSQ